MKIFVLGGGGREHALVWKLRESPGVKKIWCAPGNGGIAAEAECVAIDAGDVGAIVAFAEDDGLTRTHLGTRWLLSLRKEVAAQLALHHLRSGL